MSDPASIVREIVALLMNPGVQILPQESDRLMEQAIYGTDMMNPYIFVTLYTIFFSLLYIFVYHTKRVK